MTGRTKILVLCTGNSARSQMLEAILSARLGERVAARSAGTRPMAAVHPLAVRALDEIGIRWDDAVPKFVESLREDGFDLAITVCDNAKESCPVLPGAPRIIHIGYPDPAAATGTEEEQLQAFRDVRNSMSAWVKFIGVLLT
jgi:arsenate reductase